MQFLWYSGFLCQGAPGCRVHVAFGRLQVSKCNLIFAIGRRDIRNMKLCVFLASFAAGTTWPRNYEKSLLLLFRQQGPLTQFAKQLAACVTRSCEQGAAFMRGNNHLNAANVHAAEATHHERRS